MSARALGAVVVACGVAVAFTQAADGVVVQPPRVRCVKTPKHPTCSADVSVSVTPPSGTVYVGEDVVFTVTVANAGPDPNGGTVSLIASPRGIRLDAPGVSKGCVSTCQFNFTLGAGRNMTAQFHVRPVSAGATTLQASSDQNHLSISDPDVTNNAGSVTVDAVIGRCTSGLIGTPGSDRLFGTVGGEVVNALAGNDLVRTGAGDDCVNGGPGDDDIAGGAGADLLKGGPGSDTMSGGPGMDRISGGPGNDTISAADGERDLVNCGTGKDTVKADKIDSLSHCERVRFAR